MQTSWITVKLRLGKPTVGQEGQVVWAVRDWESMVVGVDGTDKIGMLGIRFKIFQLLK